MNKSLVSASFQNLFCKVEQQISVFVKKKKEVKLLHCPENSVRTLNNMPARRSPPPLEHHKARKTDPE